MEKIEIAIDEIYNACEFDWKKAYEMFLKLQTTITKPSTKRKVIGIYYYGLTLGGVQRVVSVFSRILIRRGYRVVFINESANDLFYELPEGVKLVRISPYGNVFHDRKYFDRACELKNTISENGIDTIVYNAASSPVLIYDLMFFKINGIRSIVVKHEMFSQCMVGRSDLVYLQQYAFAIADRLMVLSRAEQLFWKAFGVDADYICNPYPDYITPNPEIYKNENSTIIWFGRLIQQQKCIMDVIPIMSKVVEYCPDATLKIYGEECEEGILKRIEEESKKAGIKKNIIYCGYAKEDINEVFADAEILLCTSLYETFPMTIYECKAYGLPIVTYELPYVELLNQISGQVNVPQGDTVAAARAIVELLQNKDYRMQVSRGGYSSIEGFLKGNDFENRWINIIDGIESNNNVSNNEIYDQYSCIIQSMIYHYHMGIITAKAPSVIIPRVPYDLFSHRAKVIIYGAGRVGRYIVKRILQDKVWEVVKWLDTYCIEKKYPDIDIPISLPDDTINNLFFDAIIIAIHSREAAEEVKSLLEEKGVDPKKIICEPIKYTERIIF